MLNTLAIEDLHIEALLFWRQSHRFYLLCAWTIAGVEVQIKPTIYVKWKLNKISTILLPDWIKMLHLRESYEVSSKATLKKSEVIEKEIPLCFRNRNSVWVSETEWNGTTWAWSISTVKLNSSTGCNEWGDYGFMASAKIDRCIRWGLKFFKSRLGRITL